MRRLAALYVLFALLSPARGEEIGFGRDLKTAGWQIVNFPNIPPAIFKADAPDTLSIIANSAAGLLWRPMANSLQMAATAHWSWVVEEGVGPTDFSQRGKDDRALAVYFVFGDTQHRRAPQFPRAGSDSLGDEWLESSTHTAVAVAIMLG